MQAEKNHDEGPSFTAIQIKRCNRNLKSEENKMNCKNIFKWAILVVLFSITSYRLKKSDITRACNRLKKSDITRACSIYLRGVEIKPLALELEFKQQHILTGGFPCFFLSCKANARVKLAKTGHGPHSSKLVVICVLLLFVLYYVLFDVNVYGTTATECNPNCS